MLQKEKRGIKQKYKSRKQLSWKHSLPYFRNERGNVATNPIDINYMWWLLWISLQIQI